MQKIKPLSAVRRKRLEEGGFVETTAADLLGLTPQDEAWIEMKLDLKHQLRKARLASGATQKTLAERMGSAQSRVAKLEADNSEASFDLLIKGLLAPGATRNDIAKAIAGRI